MADRIDSSMYTYDIDSLLERISSLVVRVVFGTSKETGRC